MSLTDWSEALTSELSTGLRRMTDLAMQIAARPSVLLLDEPTAGVAQREAEAFGPMLRRIRDELGCSILLVEHDMPLLMGLCDRIYAMDRGSILAEGTPDQIRHDPLVVSSYLGSDVAAIERSGERSAAVEVQS
jgi:ABC-type branched-subunit amino acid transport system ATPase component